MALIVFLSSSEAPIKTTPFGVHSFSTSTNIGISALHGPHHVAQKFSTTIFPRRSLSFTLLPCISLSDNAAGFSPPAATAVGPTLIAANATAHKTILKRALAICLVNNIQLSSLVL